MDFGEGFPQHLQTVLAQSDTTAAFFFQVTTCCWPGSNQRAKEKTTEIKHRSKEEKSKTFKPKTFPSILEFGYESSISSRESRAIQSSPAALRNTHEFVGMEADLRSFCSRGKSLEQKELSHGHCQNPDGSAVLQSSAHLANRHESASKDPRKLPSIHDMAMS